ncbi:MAG TPA: cation diffusion facilitator family transporter [Methanomassiliicoccales archaeon]|nr:cation diffusion facilitator family transporter [Methanomassiliicoccales archaeon]
MARKVKYAMLSIYSNSALVGLKLIVGILMASVSVLSEAIHSGIDLIAAIIANYSVRKSTIPADKDHPYGHGKYENYAGVIEAILIFLAAALIIFEAVTRLISQAPVEFLLAGIVVMGISVAANTIVSHYLIKVGREEDSIALIADGQHLRTDVFTSLGVFLGLVLIQVTGQEILDPIVAILVAMLIIKTAYDLTKESSTGLVDRSLPEAEEQVITKILREHSFQYINFHALRTRKSGSERFIDLHLVVKRDMCILDAHELADHLEREIESKLPNTHVMIHMEPCEDKDCPYRDQDRFVKVDTSCEQPTAAAQNPSAKRPNR